MAQSSDKQYLFTLGCSDRHLRQWDIQNGLQDTCLYDFGIVADDKPFGFVIDPSSKFLVTGDGHGNLWHYDMTTRKLIKKYKREL